MSAQRQRPIDFATEGLLFAHRDGGSCGIRVYSKIMLVNVTAEPVSGVKA
jgi:hypothetical protein